MNFIQRLQRDNERQAREIEALRAGIDHIVVYCHHEKFSGPGNDHVNVVDIIARCNDAKDDGNVVAYEA